MLRPRDAAKQFGVSRSTLKRWEREGRICTHRTHGNHRRYDGNNILDSNPSQRKLYAYCRVSSQKQKDDLERQKTAMQEAHPTHEIVTDIGSGLNFKRKGLLRMVDDILRGDVEEVVVSHRDRLCRFAFDFFEWLCQRNNTRLVVKNQEIRSAELELSEDLMAIVHVFSCRHHGMRRYATKGQNQFQDNNSDENNKEEQTKVQEKASGEGSDPVPENTSSTITPTGSSTKVLDERCTRYLQPSSSPRKRRKSQTQQTSQEVSCD